MEKMEKKTKTKPKLRRKRQYKPKPRRENTIQQVYIYSGSGSKEKETFTPKYSVFGNPFPSILMPQFHTPNIGEQLISALKSVNYNNLSSSKLETPNILNETKSLTIQPKELNNDPKEPVISNQEKNEQFTEQNLEGEPINKNLDFNTPSVFNTPSEKKINRSKKIDINDLVYDATQEREYNIKNYKKLLDLKGEYEEGSKPVIGRKKAVIERNKMKLSVVNKFLGDHESNMKKPQTI